MTRGKVKKTVLHPNPFAAMSLFLRRPGSFAPAGPHTIWKKRMQKENNETKAYQALMQDIVADVVPKFYREVEYNGDCILPP